MDASCLAHPLDLIILIIGKEHKYGAHEISSAFFFLG
jgi:hypothetical protein